MYYREFINDILESRENVKFDNSERHHIVPKCVGGTDDKDNLIYLTYREHFVAHKLLAEENPDNESLLYAYWRMCNRRDTCTPEEYEEAKYRLVESIKDVPRSEETKKRISDSLLGISHPISDSTRKKISNTLKGKTVSEATKNKISTNHADFSGENNPMYGKKLSIESRKKISESRKSRTYTYSLKCNSCGEIFTSRGPRSKYCDTCKSKEGI